MFFKLEGTFLTFTLVNLVFGVSNSRLHQGGGCFLVTSVFLLLCGKYGKYKVFVSYKSVENMLNIYDEWFDLVFPTVFHLFLLVSFLLHCNFCCCQILYFFCLCMREASWVFLNKNRVSCFEARCLKLIA